VSVQLVSNVPDPPTLQTDGRTDDMQSQYRASASRGKNTAQLYRTSQWSHNGSAQGHIGLPLPALSSTESMRKSKPTLNNRAHSIHWYCSPVWALCKAVTRWQCVKTTQATIMRSSR